MPSIYLRATTPDARQLHETLRAASESPTKEMGRGRSVHSSATPSPPVQRTISTASTPSAPSLNPAIATDENDALEQQSDRGFSFFRYPRLSSMGFGRKPASPALSSQTNDDPFDGDSVVSWQLERELHRDDIQRTRPDVAYPEASKAAEGRNIRAPPRRLSGLTWNDTTHSDNTRSLDVSAMNDDSHDSHEVEDSHDSHEVEDSHDSQDEVKDDPHEVETAPAKTVISTAVHRESAESVSTRPSTADQPVTPDRHRRLPTFTVQPNTKGGSKWPFIITILTALALLAATAYSLKDRFEPNPFAHQPKPYHPINTTDGRIITQLSNEVDKLGVQISAVSQDVHRLTYEQRQMVDQVTIVSPVPADEPRINFLSPGLGTRVDPLLTSPSIGTRRTLPRRLYESLSGNHIPLPNPPEAALETWDEIGDCWCSAPGKEGQAQLALTLGQRAILDEVVVEHIPASASPDPSVAPREMELWARFKPFHGQHAPPAPSSLSSLLDAIVKTLRQAYPSDMETAYSNDRLLGPSYFRLGKWEYDQAGDAVQHFALNALIDDPALRVDKVVLRVKSNWGGNHTCLYRVRLHGHV
jgi:Sad1 / UNC-like C-terminal